MKSMQKITLFGIGQQKQETKILPLFTDWCCKSYSRDDPSCLGISSTVCEISESKHKRRPGLIQE